MAHKINKVQLWESLRAKLNLTQEGEGAQVAESVQPVIDIASLIKSLKIDSQTHNGTGNESGTLTFIVPQGTKWYLERFASQISWSNSSINCRITNDGASHYLTAYSGDASLHSESMTPILLPQGATINFDYSTAGAPGAWNFVCSIVVEEITEVYQ